MAISLEFGHFSASRMEMTPNSLVKITRTAISTCPPFPPLRGDRLAPDMVGRPRP